MAFIQQLDGRRLIKIETPKQMGRLIAESAKEMRAIGWRVTDKSFFDITKLRLDPIALLWYNDIFVSRNIAKAFYVGFLSLNRNDVPPDLVEYFTVGKISRRIFIGRNN